LATILFPSHDRADMYLGVPYDIALFTLIMNYIGEETGLLPNRLSVNIVDAHIYKNQLEAINKYLDTNILSRPSYRFCKEKGARLIDYQSGPHIPAPVAV